MPLSCPWGVDPPVIEVMIDRVLHQNFTAGGVVVEVAGSDELDVGPVRAEIDSLQRAIPADPPVVQVMIDRIADQELCAEDGSECTGGNHADIGPIRAEIDSRQRAGEDVDLPVVKV